MKLVGIAILLTVPVILLASTEVQPHMNFITIRELDAISASEITSPNDADAYVEKAASLCGIAGLLPGNIRWQLASAEYKATHNPGMLVSDTQVADAFNFISKELSVPHPARLGASDILQFRSVMAATYPNVFTPKNVNGSRPVGTLLMLYMLVSNGGIRDGVRKQSQLDPMPGSVRLTTTRSYLAPSNRTKVEAEYQYAMQDYFAKRSPVEIRFFIETVTNFILQEKK